MSAKYILKVKNESKQTGRIYVYKTCPDPNSQNLCLIEWFSKESHSGTVVSFEWEKEYSMSWSETGRIVEGVQFKASHTKETDQNSLHDTILITPHPTYWIRFEYFITEKNVDVNNISQAMEVVFAPNIYEQSFTFTKNNKWEVTGKNVDNTYKTIGEKGSSNSLYAGSECEKTNSDFEDKFYEKSNHICGYGSLTNPEPFDDFVHMGKSPFCKITKLSIWSGEILGGLEITYSNGKTYKHGRTYGAYQTLEFGEDSIVGIKGHYSVTGTHPFNAISNMIITTRFGKKFGPFGFVATGSEGKFNIGKENCHIAILFGIAHTPKEWSAQVINNIGGYYAQF